MIDENIWGGLNKDVRPVLINLLDQELIYALAAVVADNYKTQITEIDITQPADEVVQQFAQLQFKFAFWNNLPAWIKEKKLELVQAGQIPDPENQQPQ